ncbi:MAG: hypothetical protein R2818_07455 [Flavobacteriales bacterium]
MGSDGRVVIEDRFRIRGDPRDEPGHRDTTGRQARWSRNPRVGNTFMLVLIPAEQFEKAPPPSAVMNIAQQENGRFVDPFWYWLHGPGSQDEHAQVMIAPERLQVRARRTWVPVCTSK